MKSEAANGEAEFGTAPNLEADEEKRMVECYKALEAAEEKPGIEFGKAVLAFRLKIETNGSRDFMKRLEELGISYEKAHYWMNIAEGKCTKHGKSAKAQKSSAEVQGQVLSWDAVLQKLKPLVDAAVILKNRLPLGASALQGELSRLAEILNLELINKGGGNA